MSRRLANPNDVRSAPLVPEGVAADRDGLRAFLKLVDQPLREGRVEVLLLELLALGSGDNNLLVLVCRQLDVLVEAARGQVDAVRKVVAKAM